MANSSRFKNSVLMRSYAKINLSLDVLAREARENGTYHKLCMIMQTVSLYDDIKVMRTLEAGSIEILCSNHFVPNNEKNIAYKAAKLIFERYPVETAGFGLIIKIQKHIPVAAGLAGGSGNAAAVIKAMDKLFRLKMTMRIMCELGVKLGADVPYCLNGGTMLCEGIGEILTKLPPLPKTIFLLVNPKKPLSTAAVFQSIREISELPHPNTKLLLEALKLKDIDNFLKNTANSLEAPAFRLMPQIAEIKKSLINSIGVKGVLMSGSGPTVFAVFKDRESAEKAAENFDKKKYKTFIAYNVN